MLCLTLKNKNMSWIFKDYKKKKALLEAELDILKNSIEAQKLVLNIEFELRKKGGFLAADTDVNERIKNNNTIFDEVRMSCYKKMADIRAEVAKLEGYRDALKTDDSALLKEENQRLNSIIIELVKKYPNSTINITK